MIGKASEIKTTVVYSYYEYPDGSYSVKNRKWIDLGDAINRRLEELGDAHILSIQSTSQVANNDELHESALIIYKEEKA